MKSFYLFFLLAPIFFASFSFSKGEEKELLKKTAYLSLETAFKKYRLKSFKIAVKQEVFLASIKESIKSSGFLNKKGAMFLLQLKGQPSSLFLFDGNFLWYQADTQEKAVFKFKNHPQIHLLTGFFSAESFFEAFEIKQIKQYNKTYIFHIFPKKNIEGLKEIFMKVSSYILEARIIWKDLNNWQKLSFSKPVYKTFPENFFQFNKQGFQVIQKD